MTFERSNSTRLKCALVLLLACFAAKTGPAFADHAQVGAAAPPLAGTTLTGTSFSLHGWLGEVVVVHFWATWCPVCRKEMPALSQSYQLHHEQGLEVIGVSEDGKREAREVPRVMSQFAFPGALAKYLGANGFASPETLPETIVIDRDGKVQAVFQGEKELTSQLLEAAILPLLAKRP